jgi:HK97 family phage prohead protease
VTRFAGYAALFGKRDAGRDSIRPGAFAQTLAGRHDPLPLYWQHRPEQRIGWIEHAAEDARGLRVIATVDRADGVAASALRRGAVTGLSFGYRAQEVSRSPEGRELIAVELLEVSLVTHPLQHSARVHLVQKGAGARRPGLDAGPISPSHDLSRQASPTALRR